MGIDDTRGRKLSDPQRKLLFDLVDKQEAKDPKRVKATFPALPYRREGVKLQLIHPGGGMTEATVSSRSLSAMSISVLYPGFLYASTRTKVTLPRRLGGEENVDAVVQSCTHVAFAYHLINLQFERQIFPELFLDEGSWSDLLSEMDVSPASLSGRLLLIEDGELDQMLFTTQLGATTVEVTVTNSGEQAVEAIAKNPERPFELVVCDLNLGTSTGEAAITAVKKAGYLGPVLVLTAETDPGRLRSATVAGATAVLQKPCEPSRLFAALASFLQPSAGGSDEPLYSELKDPGTIALVGKYIEQVRRNLASLRGAADPADLQRVRNACQSIKGTGAGYGFPLLSTVAKEVVTALDASMSIAESMRELRRLQAVAGRLRPPIPVPEVPEVLVK